MTSEQGQVPFTQVSSSTVRVRGRRVRLWSGGLGRPLILLHGGVGGALLHWRNNLDALAAHFVVYAPDLPGFGQSDGLDDPALNNYVRWFTGFLEAVGIIDCTLLGHSVGGTVARLFAAANPDRVRRLILVNGGRLLSAPPFFESLLQIRAISDPLVRARCRQALSPAGRARLVYNPALLTPELSAEMSNARNGLTDLLRGGYVTSTTQPQRIPRCPTLVLWGEYDRLQKPAIGRKIAAELPKAQFLLLPDAGHLAMLEQPLLFQQAVLAFTGGT